MCTRSTVFDVIACARSDDCLANCGLGGTDACACIGVSVNTSHACWRSTAEGGRLRACGGAGGLHSLAIPHSNQILSWGANQNGLLGHGSHAGANVAHPTLIPDVYAQSVRAPRPRSHVDASASAVAITLQPRPSIESVSFPRSFRSRAHTRAGLRGSLTRELLRRELGVIV